MGGNRGSKRGYGGDDRDRPGNKKSKGNSWRKGPQVPVIEPGFQGIFVTCDRGKESRAIGELTEHLEEVAKELYNLDESGDGNESDDEDVDMGIEAAMAKEIESLKPKAPKERKILGMKLENECVVFFRLKHPIDPIAVTEKLCRSAVEPNFRNTKTISRLTPVTHTAKATMEGVSEAAKAALAPHFHQGQKDIKFAVRVSSRHHNALKKMEVIQEVARTVGHDHKVDLKKFDVLILVEIYKNIVGVSVVREYEKWRRFNLRELQASGVLDEAAEEVKATEATPQEETVRNDPAATDAKEVAAATTQNAAQEFKQEVEEDVKQEGAKKEEVKAEEVKEEKVKEEEVKEDVKEEPAKEKEVKEEAALPQ